MGSKSPKLSDKAHLPFKVDNKLRRQQLNVKRKRAQDSLRRAERFGRKKEESKNPHLREERLARNQPTTIDRKRKWDEINGSIENGLGVAIDVEKLQQKKVAEEEQALPDLSDGDNDWSSEDHISDADSMLDGESEAEDGTERPVNPLPTTNQLKSAQNRAISPPKSTTSTNLNLAPEALVAKFPTLFSTDDQKPTKILITTSINSTLYSEASLLTSLFPNSDFVRRSSHRYGHKFSVREIAAFAANRDYTTLMVLDEDLKRPSDLTVVHLPEGPTFHFSISNWVEGKRLPGHGNPTSHVPELILNNFRTPLGLLTATLFRSLFPVMPELTGRQVVTLHNQRDWIFVRRHRYVFRDRRESEKKIIGADGREMKGVEEIRTGLQELGPRFTLKLRRVDKGIQRRSGQEWEWKGKTDRVRTKFQL